MGSEARLRLGSPAGPKKEGEASGEEAEGVGDAPWVQMRGAQGAWSPQPQEIRPVARVWGSPVPSAAEGGPRLDHWHLRRPTGGRFGRQNNVGRRVGSPWSPEVGRILEVRNDPREESEECSAADGAGNSGAAGRRREHHGRRCVRTGRARPGPGMTAAWAAGPTGAASLLAAGRLEHAMRTAEGPAGKNQAAVHVGERSSVGAAAAVGAALTPAGARSSCEASGGPKDCRQTRTGNSRTSRPGQSGLAGWMAEAGWW